MNKLIVSVCIMCLSWVHSSAQTGIGVNAPLLNATTAELEVASATQGVLTPRMSDAQMLAIVAPAEGLLVYNLDFKMFYYFSSGWKPAGFSYRTLLRDADGDTRIEVEKTPNEDIVRFSADADNNGTVSPAAADEVAVLSATGFALTKESMTYQIEGKQVLRKTNDNIYVGTGGTLTTTGNRNTSFGYGALDNITSGNDNLAVGYNAGANLSSASNSVFAGHNVASSGGVLTGNGNVTVGADATPLLQGTAQNNIVLGYQSGAALKTGKHNILIGYNAGSNIIATDSNIVIGINQSVPDPTRKGQCNIGGVIGSDSIYNIKGNVKFSNSYTFPDKSGVANQTLVMGSGGHFKWDEKNVAGEANVTVTGAATNMQPYNKLLGVSKGMSGDIFFVPVIAMANGQISKISTFIVSHGNVDVAQLGLYTFDGTTMNIVNVSGTPFRGPVSIAGVSNEVVTFDFSAAHSKSLDVTVGQELYIAVYASNDAGSASLLEKVDADLKSKKSGTSGTRTGFTLPDTRSISGNGELMWVRAH